MLEVGKRADVNVIDFDHLELERPHLIEDLPTGARRFVRLADGYRMTIVNGVVTRREGVDTGARPGRLVRKGLYGPLPSGVMPLIVINTKFQLRSIAAGYQLLATDCCS